MEISKVQRHQTNVNIKNNLQEIAMMIVTQAKTKKRSLRVKKEKRRVLTPLTVDQRVVALRISSINPWIFNNGEILDSPHTAVITTANWILRCIRRSTDQAVASGGRHMVAIQSPVPALLVCRGNLAVTI